MKTKLALPCGLLAAMTLPAVADQKVSDRVALASGSLAPATDILPIVDVSAGTSGSKKITVNDLFTGWGVTTDGKTLVTGANFAAMRTSLGLAIGTNVQAWDADLDTWAAKTAPSGMAVGTSDTQTLTNKTLGSGTTLTAGPTMTLGSDGTGDLYYRAAGGALTRLGIGSTGQVLTVASGLPSWAAASGGGLTNWTDAVSTSSPNATVPVVSLTATNAATNVDAAIQKKGTGAILAQVPDGTATGGDKRGTNAVDWQSSRAASSAVASGIRSVVSGGYNNTASGDGSNVPGGYSNIASGGYATANGYSNTASGQSSWSPGGEEATTRGIRGMAAWASGLFSTKGDAQHGHYILRKSTTDATQTETTADGGSGSSSTRIVLPNNPAFAFRGRLIARSSTGDVAVWTIDGLVKRGANAAATALVGTPTATQTFADAGATGWVVTIDADTTNGSLRIRVTGAASTTIHWVADIETVEVS